MRVRRKVISQIYGGNGTTYANDYVTRATAPWRCR
jgi:hypothetical protein